MRDLYRLQQQVLDRKRPVADRTYLDAFRRRTFADHDVVETFHEYTKADAVWKDRARRSRGELERAVGDVRSRVDLDYAAGEVVDLPTDVEVDARLDEALLGSRPGTEQSVSRRDVARMLEFAVGRIPRDRSSTRPYPSLGTLHPCEVYLAVLDVEDLPTGLYHYDGRGYRLRRLDVGGDRDVREGVRDALELSGDREERVGDGAVVAVVTGVFWRARVEHGPRGYRYTLQGSGHVVQNLLLTARATGLRASPHVGFDDDAVNDLLGLDGVDEAALHAAVVGHGDGREDG